MAVLGDTLSRGGVRSLGASIDMDAPAETAFALLSAIEKWPLWLSFLRTAELREYTRGLGIGSEIVLRSAIPGEPEELFEVDRFIANHHISLVGAYSLRRRLDFRIESKRLRSRLHTRLEYPAYGGRLGALYDQIRSARKLAAQLDVAVVHFKHLAEYRNAKDALLADF